MNYDVVIVGTGPAGTTAGTLLAGRGLRVAVIGRACFPRDGAGIGWVGSRVVPLLDEIGADTGPILNCPINDVRFFHAEQAKSAAPELPDAPGYVIDRAAFENALVEAAIAAGADVAHESTVADVLVREDVVDVKVEDREPIRGRILLLAAGRQSSLATRLGLGAPAGTCWSAYLDVPSTSADAPDKHSVGIVLGLTRGGGFGLTVASQGRMAVAVSVPGSQAEAVAVLSRLCRLLAERGIVTVDLDSRADHVITAALPLGALEMESHVGKHALVIGEAGGFVSAVSGEGIVPGIWSAKIAAEVTAAALKSRRSQDKLMTFDTRWRLEMADYLRQPNTDMEFLIPLVFSNQPIADRMAAAFFLGDNI